MKKEIKDKAMELIVRQAELFEEVQILRKSREIVTKAMNLPKFDQGIYAHAIDEHTAVVSMVAFILGIDMKEIKDELTAIDKKYETRKQEATDKLTDIREEILEELHTKPQTKDDIIEKIKKAAEEAGKDVTVIKVSSKGGK